MLAIRFCFIAVLRKSTAVIAILILALSGLGILFVRDNFEAQGNVVQGGNPDLAEWPIPELRNPGHRVLLFMIDGLPAYVFEEAREAGLLPNIERIMATRPTAALTAVSTFPSATSPSVQELLSGRYAEMDFLSSPGAVHAFDRERHEIVRYVSRPDAWAWPVPTLFDVVRGQPVVTVFEGRWDGPTAILTQYNLASQAILKVIGATALSNGDAGPVEAYLHVLRAKEEPVVSLVVLNEFDIAAHFQGPQSTEARQALEACDKLLGEIIDTMAGLQGTADNSLLDETTIILFGDHGMVPSGQFINLAAELKNIGIGAVDVSTVPHVVFRERLGTLWTEWPDAILVAGGSNITQVYLRTPNGAWSSSEPAPANNHHCCNSADSKAQLIARMRSLPGVNQVMWEDDSATIYVARGEAEARIFLDKSTNRIRYAYVVAADRDDDPFDYLADPSAATLVCRESVPADDCYHTSVEWTDRTFATRYPAAVPLIPKAFTPSRFAGDIIATASPGYSFINHQYGDHGNLERKAILAPLILNGPGIGSCNEGHVPRLVDIYPTASVLLGASPDDPAFADLDGRVLDCVREPARDIRVQ